MVSVSDTTAAQRVARVLFEVAAHGGAQARAIGAAVATGALSELEALRPRAFISITGTGEIGHAADLFAALAGAEWDIPTMRTSRLPSWAGPLDVALVAGKDAGDPLLVEAVATATRRGVATVVSAPWEGPLRAAAAGKVMDLSAQLAGGESFGFLQSLSAHIAIARAVLSSRGSLIITPEILADIVDEEILKAHPSRLVFENPARALAHRIRERTVILTGEGPGAVSVARYGADVLLRVAGKPTHATDLANVLISNESIAAAAGGTGLSKDAVLFHDPELDGPLPSAPRVFVVSGQRSHSEVEQQIGRITDAEILQCDPTEESDSSSRFPRQEHWEDLPRLAAVAQRLALASVFVRGDEED